MPPLSGIGVSAEVEGRVLVLASPRQALDAGKLTGEMRRSAEILEANGKTVAVLADERGLPALRELQPA